MKKIISLIVVLAFLCVPFSATAIDVKNDSEAKYYVEGEAILLYRLVLPENYDESKSYPLILFLHGAGERGDNNTSQLNNAVQRIADNAPNAIIVAPQCPYDNKWVDAEWTNVSYSTDEIPESNELKLVMGMLEKVQKEYSVDKERIYASGISMGGFGTWDLIVRHPNTFAAAIPVCGGADYTKAERLVNMPIYTFHGDSDWDVPVQGTRAMVEAIKSAGGDKITYTEYAGMGHAIWEDAFGTPGLYDNLFSHKLSDRPLVVLEDESASSEIVSSESISSETSSVAEVSSMVTSSDIEGKGSNDDYIYIIIAVVAGLIVVAVISVLIVKIKKKQ